MIKSFKYQQIIKNKPNYLDPLVWEFDLDPYSLNPDREVSYWKQKTNSHIFYGRGSVDLSIDYDLKFYSKRLQEKGLKKYDFIPNDSGSPLVSARVVEKLNELCPDEFQAIPAKIGKEDKKTGEYITFDIDCYLINLLKYVDCVDRDRSTYDFFVNIPSTISYVEKLFFLPNCMQNYMMARAKEPKYLIIVSPKFAKIFSEPPYYGGFFQTPEECYNAVYNGNYWEKEDKKDKQT